MKDYKIKSLSYFRIDEGFYELMAITDDGKICIEGNVCIGILKEFIAKAKHHKAEIKRCSSPVIHKALLEENKSLKSWQKLVEKKFEQIQKIAKSIT